MNTAGFTQATKNIRKRLTAMAERILPDRDEAEDAVQDTLLKLWIVRNGIADENGFARLAITVVRNLCIDRLRRAKNTAVVPLDTLQRTLPAENAPLQMESREDDLWLEQALGKIPESHRIILQMRHMEGYSYSQIAEILGTTESSIRGMLSKARRKMIMLYNQRE